jgi:biopolymer transport protein ExbD
MTRRTGFLVFLFAAGIVALAAQMVLRPFQGGAQRPSRVIVYVEKDGGMTLNGKHFTDRALLQAALVDACGEKPKPMFYLRTDKATTLDQTDNAMAIAAQAGCLRMNMRDPSYTPPGPK